MSTKITPGTDRYAQYPGGEVEYWMRFATRVMALAGAPDVGPSLVMAALQRLRDAFGTPDNWEIYPDVVPTLIRLCDEGFRLAVVSNWDSRLPKLLKMLELDRYFEELGVSHVEGFEKPHPELFRRVLSRLGADPGTALHVGDRPELDLSGGHAAGVDVLLIDRNGRLGDEHRAVRDLAALPEIARSGADEVVPVRAGGGGISPS